MPAALTDIRLQFFDLLYGEQEGFACIATTKAKGGKETWSQVFFAWPRQRKELNEFIDKMRARRNIYFSVNLFDRPQRGKDYCIETPLVWADLDTANPDEVDPKPNIVVESSPGRYQAIWHMDKPVDPFIAENYSKRVAYLFRHNGADVSGWDLGQMLRVPFTFNYKYEKHGESVPEVKLKRGQPLTAQASVFEGLPLPEGDDHTLDEEAPTEIPDHEKVITQYYKELKETAFYYLYDHNPDSGADWSALLWRLINICLEAGMSDVEVYAVAKVSKCNKYERDKRPTRYLWRDVKKATARKISLTIVEGKILPLELPELFKGEKPHRTIIDDYVSWAEKQTDAPVEFHELGAFMLLSSLIADRVKLEMSWGTVVPNLWGLILGESTYTRKTTATSMVMSILYDIDPDIELATEGSIEGILQGLVNRPGRTSLIRRDEFVGFISAAQRRDYLTGMLEVLTALYDCPKRFVRRLRKETITVREPVFLMFGSGVKEVFYSIVSEEQVTSGFLPRFLVVAGGSDRLERRPGPPTLQGNEGRIKLVRDFEEVYQRYSQEKSIKLGDQTITVLDRADAVLTEDAWERYGDIYELLRDAAQASPHHLIADPTFNRLTTSLIKMAVLAAATRTDDRVVTVDVDDIDYAASYIQRWGQHSIDLILNAGTNITERQIGRILRTVQNEPGILRSDVMRTHHFTKQQMDMLLGTLEDRAYITTRKEGKSVRLWPL